MVLTAAGALRRFAAAIHAPADIVLALKILLFIVRAPADLSRADVATFLQRLRTARRPTAANVILASERIMRLRNVCLSMPVLWRRNTCYVRALTLYRFLDAGKRDLRVHFGVEMPSSPQERLHGHAWVTLDGTLLEGPEPVILGRVREVMVDGRR